jgi:LysM repeat protein
VTVVKTSARAAIMGSMAVTLGVIVVSACASSEPNAIGTLPILNTVPRTVPIEMQTTTTAAVEVQYTVQRFDTLFEIARAFGVTMDDLAEYNGIGQDEYDSIQAGQVLKVPNPSNPSGTFAPQ